MTKVIVRHDGEIPPQAKGLVGTVMDADVSTGALIFNETAFGGRPPLVARPTGEVESIDGEPVPVFRFIDQ